MWKRPGFRIVFVLVLVAGLVLTGLDLGLSIDYIGAFPLEVHFQQEGGRRAERISATILSMREMAEGARSYPPDLWEKDFHFRPVMELNGDSFTVLVTCCGVRSGLGRELRYWEHHVVVLKVKFSDGVTEYVVVDVPEGRGRRAYLLAGRTLSEFDRGP